MTSPATLQTSQTFTHTEGRQGLWEGSGEHCGLVLQATLRHYYLVHIEVLVSLSACEALRGVEYHDMSINLNVFFFSFFFFATVEIPFQTEDLDFYLMSLCRDLSVSARSEQFDVL